MLLVDVRTAKPGMVLALPIYHPRQPDCILLQMEYALTQRDIIRLDQMGVSSFWVRYPGLDFLSKFVNQEAMAAQGDILRQISNTFEHAQRQSNAKLPYQEYCNSIGQLISSLVGNPRAALFMGDLIRNSGSDDLMRHSTTVTYLSVLIGLKLEGYLVRQRRHMDPSRAKEVTNLGVGAMLHDLGVTQLPPEVHERRVQLDDDTDPAWREHPSLGYSMVRGQVEPTAATVVLNHHQRFDGTGYAGGDTPILEGERIHVFARIVALANDFDRLRNPFNQPSRPTVVALRQVLQEDTLRRYDPQVVRALLAVVPPYPPGMLVRLSDGRSAVCIDHVPSDPCRPIVQLIPEFDRPHAVPGKPMEIINLSKANPSLHVAYAGDEPVARLNFPAPKLMLGAAALFAGW